ncbi:MAG: type II secretion system inner membrane protein GspF [Candidatus Auribacterota bacterium]|nr:type II secretion system inner membrane protein GspF [Candidatus Auribacterota bacterium]
MPVFDYKALTASGEQVAGIIDADSPADARAKLRRDRVFPTEVTESDERVDLRSDQAISRLFHRIKPADVAVFTRQMATLLSSGLQLIQGLDALIDQLERSPLKRVIIGVRDDVNAGKSFADSLRRFPRTFTQLYINMVQAGESAGALDVVLERLADLTEKNVKMRNHIRSVMVYPTLVAFIGLAVIIFLLVKVVPTITSIFEETQQALPLPTVILLNVSDFLRNYWWIIVFISVGFYFLFSAWKKGKKGRLLIDRVKLRLPLVGSLIRKISVVRFSRTLATLLSSGAPLLESMEIVKNIVNNTSIASAIEQAIEAIRGGHSVSGPFRKSKIFPPIVVHMIAVGETSGSLEPMLEKIAQSYEDEVETSVSAMTSLLEPIMIVIMGIVVGYIVLSILLPIFQMSEIIS